MASAESTWESLSDPWRAAFDEAWTSWSNGCIGIGIGAVAVGRDGEMAGGSTIDALDHVWHEGA